MTGEWQKMRRYDGITVLMANLPPIINGYYINGGTYTYTVTYLNIEPITDFNESEETVSIESFDFRSAIYRYSIDNY